MPEDARKLKIVFVHPDLGIGGAERLVIDAAVGLQSLGHKVTILTSYCNRNHCFEEARDAARLNILFAVLRQIALVFSTSVFSSELRNLDPDVFIVDQLSACVPLFRLLSPRSRILFYGHYPDRLLIKQDKGFLQRLKSAYRIPFDLLEGWSTGCSDSIAVNSKFTKSVFRSTFPALRSRGLRVLYPCVDTTAVDTPASVPLWPSRKVLLSINRFEGTKNLDLAITAFAGLPKDEQANARLVLAGGYDPRNAENATCLKHLQTLADSLELQHETFKSQDTSPSTLTGTSSEVLFLLSIPHELKLRLLSEASLLLYTPSNEHFGIVPLEAMLAGVPVLATDSGGPLETIYNERTGFHRSPNKIEQWTAVMRKPLIPSSVASLKAIGQRGRERVLSEFSRTQMSQNFERELRRMVQSTGPRPAIVPAAMLVVAALLVAVHAIVIAALVYTR